MNTIREGMTNTMKELLMTQKIISEAQAYEWGCGIADHLGLHDLEGDQIGQMACVMMSALQGSSSVVSVSSVEVC